jgi:hypothetical protein
VVDDERVRYDWNVYKDPQRALIERAGTWALALGAVAAFPVFLWLAVAWYWPMALAPAPLAVAAVGARMALRAHYGIREARPPGRAQTHAEEVAEAVEAQRQRQWDLIADRAYRAAGGAGTGPRGPGWHVAGDLVTRTPAGRAAPEPAVAHPSAGAVKLDHRWEWQLARGLGVPDRWVKVRCLHTEVEPVRSLAGDVVAQLCLTCDTQFPAPREP